MDFLEKTIVPIALLVIVGYFARNILKLVISYKIADDSISVMLFRKIPIFKIRFSEISSMGHHTTTLSSLLSFKFAFRFGNTFTLHSIVIHRLNGALDVYVTPPNPDAFINTFKIYKSMHTGH